jgi:hypothetical protein
MCRVRRSALLAAPPAISLRHQPLGWGGLVCLGVWRIDEEDEMLLPSLHRIRLVVRPGPIIWRRAAASDVIWRSTVDFRPPRAIFRQGRTWYAKFEELPPSDRTHSPILQSK